MLTQLFQVQLVPQVQQDQQVALVLQDLLEQIAQYLVLQDQREQLATLEQLVLRERQVLLVLYLQIMLYQLMVLLEP